MRTVILLAYSILEFLMNKPLTLVANFKMNLSHADQVAYVRDNYEDLKQYAASSAHTLILCPSFISLASIAPLLATTRTALGAQDCSTEARGAFTGQISAPLLYEVGCRYGIVGHSETRTAYSLSDAAIARKVSQLVSASIAPIVCCGEAPGADWRTRLTEQLAPVLAALQRAQGINEVIIAYEPLSAIGSGNVAKNSHLEVVFEFLSALTTDAHLDLPIKLVYGGSVNCENSSALLKIPTISGFLVGNACLNFHDFIKIVN